MFLASSCERGSNEAYVDFGKIEKTPRYVLRLLIFFATPKQRAGQADGPKSERTSCLAGGSLTHVST